MEVVEHENERLGLRKQLEQLTDGSVAAVALVLDRSFPFCGEPGERRENGRELRSDVLVEALEAMRVEPADVFVERIHEDPKREVPLELGRRPREHEIATLLGPHRQLAEQPGLADPGLPRQLDRGRSPAFELVQDLVKGPELLGAPNEVAEGFSSRATP